MSDLQTRDLAALENIIERGMTTFVDVGTALAEIRDRELYRERHHTFESYCQERWGFSRRRAYQMIEAASITEALCTTVHTPLPIHERQVRELVRVEPERRAEVWQAVVEEHGPTASAGDVQHIADRFVSDVMNSVDMAAGRLRLEFFREIKHLASLVQLKPDSLAAVIERDDVPAIRMQLRDARQWIEQVERAIEPRGLRVVS